MIGKGKESNNIRDKPDDKDRGSTNDDGQGTGRRGQWNNTTELRMVLVKLTVVVAGIVITGWVARLVRYNYRATRIALVGEEDKDRGHARKEERKEGDF